MRSPEAAGPAKLVRPTGDPRRRAPARHPDRNAAGAAARAACDRLRKRRLRLEEMPFADHWRRRPLGGFRAGSRRLGGYFFDRDPGPHRPDIDDLASAVFRPDIGALLASGAPIAADSRPLGRTASDPPPAGPATV